MSIKNLILKLITYIAVILFLLSAGAIDSASWVPLTVCLVSIAWLALFAYANDAWTTEKREKREMRWRK